MVRIDEIASASPSVSLSRWFPGPKNHPSNLTVAILVMITCVAPVFLVGTLAIQIDRSLHLGASGLGLAIAFFYLGSAVFAVPAGLIADAVGSAKVMRAAALSSAVLLALIVMTVRSWTILVVLLFLGGAIQAAANTATNRNLARRIPMRSQGRSFGIKQSAVPLATLLAGLAVPVVTLIGGWRWAFGLGAAAALLAATLVSVPRRTRVKATVPRRTKTSRTTQVAPLATLALGQGLGVFAASSLAAFFVTGGVDAGLTPSTAGLTAALGAGLAAITRIAVGHRADRRGDGHFGTVAVMLATGTGGYLALAVGAATSTAWIFVVGACIAFGIGWGWNGLMNFAVTLSHPHAPANATGILQVGMGLGGIIGPLTLGLVAEHHSYPLLWMVAGGTNLLAAGAVLVGNRHLR